MKTSSKTASGFFEPFLVDDVPWDDYTQGERFASRPRALGAFGCGTHVGVCLEELAPGK